MNPARRLSINVYEQYVRPVLYMVREWWPFWFNILNRKPRKLYLSSPVTLTPLEKRLTKELSQTGITTTSLEELFGTAYPLDVLRDYIKTLPTQDKKETAMKKESFQTRLWSVKPVLDFTNPFLRLALEPTVFRIANTYMQMWTKLKYYDLAITYPVSGTADAQFSQRWHRDPEEKRVVKLFIYLTDVDSGCGPFTYVPGSPYGMDPYGRSFPQQPPEGCYPDPKEFDSQIPPEAFKVMTGKAGTIILCDTSGLHRGGYATRGERTMFTSLYAAPSSTQAVWYSHKNDAPLPEILCAEAKYSLTK